MLLSGPHILFILCRVRWRWLRPGQTLGHGAYAFLDALFFWSDFNYDYQVSFTKEEIAKGKAYHNYKIQEIEIEEMSGLSVFYKNVAGDVFHTYSTYGRGSEELVSAYVCLDLMPKGRNETGPGFNLGDWVRHHDRYDDDDFDFTEPYQPTKA
jgi:Bacterial protein of unknown function (DUF899)